MFDVTEDATDFQWQLVHSDCAERCQQFSIRTLRFLAQKIKAYGPEREKITSTLGTDIEKVYKDFLHHLQSLKSILKNNNINVEDAPLTFEKIDKLEKPKIKDQITPPEKQNIGKSTLEYLISYKNQNNLSMEKTKRLCPKKLSAI